MVSLLLVQSPICFIQHSEIFRVLPPSATLASCIKETQKCERVHVVRAPRAARETFIVELLLCLQESFPLHLSQGHSDAKILFPLRLKPFRYGLVCRSEERRVGKERRSR